MGERLIETPAQRKRRSRMKPFSMNDIYIEISPGLKKRLNDNLLVDYVEDSASGNCIMRLNIDSLPSDLTEIEEQLGFTIGKFPDKGDIKTLWPKKDDIA